MYNIIGPSRKELSVVCYNVHRLEELTLINNIPNMPYNTTSYTILSQLKQFQLQFSTSLKLAV